MTATTNETKIMDKINKLLKLSGNNNSQEEAQSALLMAQELMAKYDIDMTTFTEEIEYELVACKHRDNSGFRGPLASIIAINFRCKAIMIGNTVHFLGHKTDAQIAKNVFEFAYRFVKNEGEKEIKKAREIYGTSRNVFNSYSKGFMAGLKAKLDAQCTALMIVTPQDVDDKFEDMFPQTRKGRKMQQNNIMGSVFDKGYQDGQTALDRRALEK